MYINYSDENDRLTPEIWNLVQQAADKAMELELGERLATHGISVADADVEIGVTIVSDDEILELNREYREKDSVTDVLSFPQFEELEGIEEALRDENESSLLLGDVVICYDQAMRQAEEYGTGTTRELLYLFVHSVMHLMGYDHENEEDKKIMRTHEEAVLEGIGVKK